MSPLPIGTRQAHRGYMRAQVGDRMVVEGRTDTNARRGGEVIEVRGEDGTPPYVVRWDDGHEGLVFPGPDAHIVPSTST